MSRQIAVRVGVDSILGSIEVSKAAEPGPPDDAVATLVVRCVPGEEVKLQMTREAALTLVEEIQAAFPDVPAKAARAGGLAAIGMPQP